MLFNSKTRSEYSNEKYDTVIENYLKKYSKIVIKANNGSVGRNVFFSTDVENSLKYINQIFEKEDNLSICPYYESKMEYRAFFLDGKIEYIYGKERPFIIGDGISKVSELIDKNFSEYEVNASDLIDKLDLNYIPNNGEKITVSWKYNLSGGANPVSIKDKELYSKIESLALKTGTALNIKFATIDILDTNTDGLMVLEVNSSVCGQNFSEKTDGGYDIFKSIYEKAIDKLFE